MVHVGELVRVVVPAHAGGNRYEGEYVYIVLSIDKWEECKVRALSNEMVSSFSVRYLSPVDILEQMYEDYLASEKPL